MKLRTLLILVISLLSLFSYSQELMSDTIQFDHNKNSIYGSVGSFWIYGMTMNVNYERLISNPESGLIKSYWLRSGGGLYWSWENGNDVNFLSGITALSGKKNSHLETLIGLSFHYSLKDLSSRFSVLPAGAIGYRFQKTNGLFMFRIGVGFPDNVYVSFGLNF